MKKTVRRTMAVLLSAAVPLAGCQHYSQVETSPPNASIEAVDLVVRGNTLEARSGFAESHVVRVSAPGYVAREFVVHKSYRADISLVLILFGIVPYFFTARLEDHYVFQLQPIGGPVPPPAPGPEPSPSPAPGPEPSPAPGPGPG